jgi:hypothetical protein
MTGTCGQYYEEIFGDIFIKPSCAEIVMGTVL